MKIDFHVHTYYSYDSFIRPVDLVARSIAFGVVPAIADHNTVAAHETFKSLGVPFIPAEEIGTDIGDLIGLFITEEIKKHTPFEEALDLIHEQGGIAYLPHMFDLTRHGISDPKLASKVDIIEIFNSRCLDKSLNSKAKQFAEQNNLPGAVGTDSHFIFEFGKTYTEIPKFSFDGLENPNVLLKALKTQNPNPKTGCGKPGTGHTTLNTKPKTGNPTHETHPAPFYVRGTTSVLALGKKFLLRGF
ncbi:PHP domain-containing protein [Candidatus Micrarchaeota archaeon]|nr:PHP domain-containing protein [Candidatus Micrarchaeota archaeon]MBU1166131.1 PHP domain-containing protein [Candidatus Micrarchaeota archaeon]MBU1887326.1 PHP domain-containing protein [Candidatus Micrarchaeota archaeon]